MSVKVVVLPTVPPLSWEDFCATHHWGSLALDGYVAGPPRYSATTGHLSVNHHEGVDRSATHASCGQILILIRQGLFDAFPGGLTVYVNDCDEDVCLAIWLLTNHHLAVGVMNPLINRLVHMEDMMDATAGAYPFPVDLPVLGHLAWIFEPYRLLRGSGRLDAKDPAEFRAVIDDVGRRIQAHVCGGASQVIDLDVRYNVIGQHPMGDSGSWHVVEEIGGQARTAMFAKGIRAFTSVRRRPDGRFTYVIGRMSVFIPFPVQAIFDALNVVEGLTGKPDCWGGGNIIGGSPRVAGTSLSPAEIATIVNATIASPSPA